MPTPTHTDAHPSMHQRVCPFARSSVARRPSACVAIYINSNTCFPYLEGQLHKRGHARHLLLLEPAALQRVLLRHPPLVVAGVPGVDLVLVLGREVTPAGEAPPEVPERRDMLAGRVLVSQVWHRRDLTGGGGGGCGGGGVGVVGGGGGGGGVVWCEG
jgi:hypothetical protein